MHCYQIPRGEGWCSRDHTVRTNGPELPFPTWQKLGGGPLVETQGKSRKGAPKLTILETPLISQQESSLWVSEFHSSPVQMPTVRLELNKTKQKQDNTPERKRAA